MFDDVLVRKRSTSYTKDNLLALLSKIVLNAKAVCNKKRVSNLIRYRLKHIGKHIGKQNSFKQTRNQK